MSDLKSCPFCGSENVAVHKHDSDYEHVMCVACGAGGPEALGEGNAMTGWNLRTIPDWKGYALLGTGCYAINHTPGPPDPELGAELVISIATEADKSGGRQVGEERDTDHESGPLMPEQMAIRIGFLTATALDALESQLRHLRRENFPDTSGVSELDAQTKPPAGTDAQEGSK